MKPAISLVVIVGIIIFMWSSAALRHTEATRSSICQVELTQQIYNELCKGMRPDQVVALVGCNASTKVEAESTTSSYLHLSWTDQRGAWLRAEFQNGSLTLKDGHNLKH